MKFLKKIRFLNDEGSYLTFNRSFGVGACRIILTMIENIDCQEYAGNILALLFSMLQKETALELCNQHNTDFSKIIIQSLLMVFFNNAQYVTFNYMSANELAKVFDKLDSYVQHFNKRSHLRRVIIGLASAFISVPSRLQEAVRLERLGMHLVELV
jgi:hypothetical protein